LNCYWFEIDVRGEEKRGMRDDDNGVREQRAEAGGLRAGSQQR
jgi:hypothetical protein